MEKEILSSKGNLLGKFKNVGSPLGLAKLQIFYKASSTLIFTIFENFYIVLLSIQKCIEIQVSEKKFVKNFHSRDIPLGHKSSKRGSPLKFYFFQKFFLPLFSSQKIHKKFGVGRKNPEKNFDFATPNMDFSLRLMDLNVI